MAGKLSGTFWMPWESFKDIFDLVDVCIRTTGMDDLKLDVNEAFY